MSARICREVARVGAVWVILAWSPAVGAVDPQPHPAYVDGRPIAALAGQRDKVVDMDIDAALLKSLSRRYAKDNPELAAFLDHLVLINSVVITFETAGPRQTVGPAILALETRLQKAAWRRLASIREPGLQLRAFVHMKHDDIDGLVIVSVEENRLMFSNLAGRIDLAQLARLRGTLTVPGLDRLPHEIKKQGTQSAPDGGSDASGDRP